MKIAVVTNYFPVVSETFVINHVISLIESGHIVTIFSINPKSSSTILHPQLQQYRLLTMTNYGVRIPDKAYQRITLLARMLAANIMGHKTFKTLKALNFFRFGKSALKLRMFYHSQLFLEKNEFDVIHCHFGNVGNDIRKLHEAGLVKGKMVVSFHGYEFLQDKIIKENHGYRKLFVQSHKIIANSTFTLKRLIGLGCESQKISILPVIASHSVFEREFQPARKTDQPFQVLTIARLIEKKGVEYGIRAIAFLKRNYALNINYHVVGGGPLMPALTRLIKENGLENNVVLHGAKSQDEVAKFLAQADIFLLPSIVDSNGDTETQGLALIEAQLMGLPVVSTRVGGIPESICENVTGLLVDEKNPEQIANAILELYNKEKQREAFGLAGKKFVAEKFSSFTISEKMNHMYQQLFDSPLPAN
jgi:colanic acid/amylovoran biosynthesis glycosyltransferase